MSKSPAEASEEAKGSEGQAQAAEGNGEAQGAAKDITPPQVKSEADKDYYKVPSELYREGDKVETDLYMYYQGQYILNKSKGIKWTDQDSERLASFGVSNLFIKFKSPKEHRDYLDQKLTTLLDRQNVPISRKANVLYEISDPILDGVHSGPEDSGTMESAKGYVKNCIKYLNEKNSLPELVMLSSKNLTEHAHALHTSAYAVALARKAARRNYSYDEILTLGMGALLHDIGKSKIDGEILNKETELEDDEWQLLRKHPILGEKILSKKKLVPSLSIKIVLEHHERVNGKGYPHGIRKMHEFSQMVAIADVFNSITSKRPWAPAKTPYETLKVMATTMNEEFDRDLLKAFIEMLGG